MPRIRTSLYTAWSFWWWATLDPRKPPKYFLSEKQLMNFFILCYLATYSLCNFSKQYSPSKSMKITTIQLPIQNTSFK